MTISLDPAILALTSDEDARQKVEGELNWLILFNLPDPVIVDASVLWVDTTKRLADGTAGQKYLVETLRLLCEVIRPFFEEAPGYKVEALGKWYNVLFPPGPLGEPNFIFTDVSDTVWAAWKRASELRTLASLTEMARSKGLDLVVETDYALSKYRIVYQGTPGATPLVYKEAAKRIEKY